MNIRLLPAVGALLGAICLATTNAATINVQFGSGTYFGPGAASSPDAGIYWNFYTERSGARMLDLMDSQGADTPVVIWATYHSAFRGGPAPTSGDKGRSPGHLLGSGLYGPIELNVQSLPGKTYDVYAYVYNKSNEPTTVTLTHADGSSVREPSPVNNDTEYRLNENYVVFSNVTPRGVGRLTLAVEGAWTGLNGVQFVERASNPPQNPPTVRIRSKAGTISARRPRITISGTASSDVGIRGVWVSHGNSWRLARGTSDWKIQMSASQRTRVFVRAEDVNGTFSSPESVVIVPKRKR